MIKIVVVENEETILKDEHKSYVLKLIEMNEQIRFHLKLRSQPIELINDHTFKVNGIIGNISLNGLNLIIVPKYKSELRKSQNSNLYLKDLYYRILVCSNDKMQSTIYFTKNHMIDNDSMMVDVIANYFIKTLNEALKKAHIITYKENIEKLTTLRGKVLVQKQLENPMIDARTWCRYKQMSRDNIFNQLITWTCKYLYDISKDQLIRSRLRKLFASFSFQDTILDYKSVNSIKLPRNFNMYESTIRIAKNLYLGNKNMSEKNEYKSGVISGYVINMEKAFENIVMYYTTKSSYYLKIDHKAQMDIPLASHETSEYLNYSVRPDDLLYTNHQSLVIDAKYKLIGDSEDKYNKPKREDLYQMISTCIASNTWEAILFYPQSDNEINSIWKLNTYVNEKRISVRAVSVDILSSENQIIESFIQLFKSTEFYKEVIDEQKILISVK